MLSGGRSGSNCFTLFLSCYRYLFDMDHVICRYFRSQSCPFRKKFFFFSHAVRYGTGTVLRFSFCNSQFYILYESASSFLFQKLIIWYSGPPAVPGLPRIFAPRSKDGREGRLLCLHYFNNTVEGLGFCTMYVTAEIFPLTPSQRIPS